MIGKKGRERRRNIYPNTRIYGTSRDLTTGTREHKTTLVALIAEELGDVPMKRLTVNRSPSSWMTTPIGPRSPIAVLVS